MLQKKTNAKFVFEVHDLWPLSPMELGNIPSWHPYIMLMQKAENDAYRYCDKVVSILPCALEHMVQHGLQPDKFVHIPNGIYVDDWEDKGNLPFEHRNIINELKEEKRFIVGYAGAHGIANSLHTLIDAAEKCRNDNVVFILVGQGPEKRDLQMEVEKRGLGNVALLPAVNKTEVASLLELFDVCFIAWQRNKLYRFGISPNKLMDYMMAAKPIIHAVEAGNDPVKEAGCGISVPPEDPGAVADAIKKLAAMSEVEREQMGLRGREYVLNNHDYRVIARRFLEVLER
jgi:glycosyltransferase involved in cell wall biosynthesis